MRLTHCWVLLYAVFGVGCEPPGPRTYAVSGTVTYDGQPVSHGDIIFVPENPSLAPDAGKVDSGRFRARAKEGPCRVEITALNIGPNTPVVMGSPLAENYIPERYNRASQLTAQVSATDENTYAFDLTSSALYLKGRWRRVAGTGGVASPGGVCGCSQGRSGGDGRIR